MTSFDLSRHDDDFVLCLNCRRFVKQSKSFIKTWNSSIWSRSGLCLCRKCAVELAKEIENKYKDRNDDKVC